MCTHSNSVAAVWSRILVIVLFYMWAGGAELVNAQAVHVEWLEFEDDGRRFLVLNAYDVDPAASTAESASDAVKETPDHGHGSSGDPVERADEASAGAPRQADRAGDSYDSRSAARGASTGTAVRPLIVEFPLTAVPDPQRARPFLDALESVGDAPGPASSWKPESLQDWQKLLNILTTRNEIWLHGKDIVSYEISDLLKDVYATQGYPSGANPVFPHLERGLLTALDSDGRVLPSLELEVDGRQSDGVAYQVVTFANLGRHPVQVYSSRKLLAPVDLSGMEFTVHPDEKVRRLLKLESSILAFGQRESRAVVRYVSGERNFDALQVIAHHQGWIQSFTTRLVSVALFQIGSWDEFALSHVLLAGTGLLLILVYFFAVRGAVPAMLRRPSGQDVRERVGISSLQGRETITRLLVRLRWRGRRLPAIESASASGETRSTLADSLRDRLRTARSGIRERLRGSAVLRAEGPNPQIDLDDRAYMADDQVVDVSDYLADDIAYDQVNDLADDQAEEAGLEGDGYTLESLPSLDHEEVRQNAGISSAEVSSRRAFRHHVVAIAAESASPSQPVQSVQNGVTAPREMNQDDDSARTPGLPKGKPESPIQGPTSDSSGGDGRSVNTRRSRNTRMSRRETASDEAGGDPPTPADGPGANLEAGSQPAPSDGSAGVMKASNQLALQLETAAKIEVINPPDRRHHSAAANGVDDERGERRDAASTNGTDDQAGERVDSAPTNGVDDQPVHRLDSVVTNGVVDEYGLRLDTAATSGVHDKSGLRLDSAATSEVEDQSAQRLASTSLKDADDDLNSSGTTAEIIEEASGDVLLDRETAAADSPPGAASALAAFMATVPLKARDAFITLRQNLRQGIASTGQNIVLPLRRRASDMLRVAHATSRRRLAKLITRTRQLAINLYLYREVESEPIVPRDGTECVERIRVLAAEIRPEADPSVLEPAKRSIRKEARQLARRLDSDLLQEYVSPTTTNFQILYALRLLTTVLDGPPEELPDNLNRWLEGADHVLRYEGREGIGPTIPAFLNLINGRR